MAVAFLLAPWPALGQAKDEVPPTVIDADRPGTRVQIGHGDETVASCTTPCPVHILPGKYQLYVLGEDDEKVLVKARIVGGERLMLSSPNPTLRWTGLALGVAGAVSAAVGGLLLFALTSGSTEGCNSDCEDHPPRWALPTTVATLIVGAVATPIGWTMFANNRKPRIESTPLEGGPPRAPAAPTLSVAPFHDGAMLSGVVRF
jgi:hypothetical protein